MGGVGKPRPPVYGKLRLCAAFGCGKKKGAQPYPAVRKREAHGQSRSCADNTSCFGFGNGDSPGAAHLVSDLSRRFTRGHHSDLLAGHLTPFRRQSVKDRHTVLLCTCQVSVYHMIPEMTTPTQVYSPCIAALLRHFRRSVRTKAPRGIAAGRFFLTYSETDRPAYPTGAAWSFSPP